MARESPEEDDDESTLGIESDPRERDSGREVDAERTDTGRELDPEERDAGTDVDTEAEYDAEELHTEWLFWVAAIVIVVGAGLLIAPPEMVPELAVGLAPIFVLIGVVGWLGQWIYRRYRS